MGPQAPTGSPARFGGARPGGRLNFGSGVLVRGRIAATVLIAGMTACSRVPSVDSPHPQTFSIRDLGTTAAASPLSEVRAGDVRAVFPDGWHARPLPEGTVPQEGFVASPRLDRFERAIAIAPDRVINVGIMEQTLVGVAAGFAMEGFHTIAHTMAPFLVERPFEQVKLDFGYQGLAGTLASVGAPYDYGTEGGTHHSPGDVGVVLTVPRTDVLVPGCAGELDRLLRETYADGRLTYLRASVAQNDVAFEVARGRLEVVRRGTRATVVVVGPLLSRTLAACEGLDVSVLYTASVAPFDSRGLAAIAGPDPLVIAVEPFYEGTLLPSLAEALRHVPSRFAAVGVPRRFITTYGTAEEHDRELGMDVAGIRRRLVAALEPG